MLVCLVHVASAMARDNCLRPVVEISALFAGIYTRVAIGVLDEIYHKMYRDTYISDIYNVMRHEYTGTCT